MSNKVQPHAHKTHNLQESLSISFGFTANKDMIANPFVASSLCHFTSILSLKCVATESNETAGVKRQAD